MLHSTGLADTESQSNVQKTVENGQYHLAQDPLSARSDTLHPNTFMAEGSKQEHQDKYVLTLMTAIVKKLLGHYLQILSKVTSTFIASII